MVSDSAIPFMPATPAPTRESPADLCEPEHFSRPPAATRSPMSKAVPHLERQRPSVSVAVEAGLLGGDAAAGHLHELHADAGVRLRLVEGGKRPGTSGVRVRLGH